MLLARSWVDIAGAWLRASMVTIVVGGSGREVFSFGFVMRTTPQTGTCGS